VSSPSSRPAASVSLASLEGLVAGACAGAILLALERSPTFNVFADVLNATFRVLSSRFPEALLVRLDTEGVALAAYVGGHAVLGALVGAGLAVALRRAASGGRRVLLALVLFLVDTAVFGAVWRHRGLSFVLGGSLTGGAAAAALAVSFVVGPAFARLSSRVRGALAVAAPVLVVAIGAATLAAAARGPDRPEGRTLAYPRREPTGVKVAILGLDGLDWVLVDEIVAAGSMPTLAALIDEGVRGDLRSIRPPKSPVVWTSMATGRLPSVHGITDFVVRREGRRIPVTSNLRRAPALWDLARPIGYDVAFVNWYVTWPAEDVAGVMISDRVDFDGLERRVTPPELLPRIEAARARVEERPDRHVARFTALDGSFDEWRARRWGQVRRALGILDDVVRHDLVTIETTRVALTDGQPDLTAVYFRGNDNTQHLFWKYRLAARSRSTLTDLLYEDVPAADVDALSGVVDRYYEFADRLIAETLEMLDPDTALLVLSDHGFLTNNERSRWWNVNRILEAAGLAVVIPQSGGEADEAASVVFDPDPPSVDALRRLRAGGAARSDEEALERAREVLAGARTDAGDPVFRRLERADDEIGPHLVAVFERDPGGHTLSVAGRELAREEFTVPEGHSGDHRMNGFLLAVGGPFRRGATIEGARALDIAPTVLHLLGAPAALDMEGVVLEDLFEPEWREEHPVRYVGTYGLLDAAETEAIETGADEKIREELRALGYIQ
jgi:predicted AlkP superfamily phosphohydrolase/phosphomutase